MVWRFHRKPPMFQFRSSCPADVPGLADIWRRSVRATHTFLTEADFRTIETAVETLYLPNAQLTVATDEQGRLAGFMGMTGSNIDSLFLDPDYRGQGLGRLFIDYAIEVAALGPVTVDVNEQNTQAVGFYRHMGFVETGRSPTDDDGRPYPLIHMRRD